MKKLDEKLSGAGLLIIRVWISQEFMQAGLMKLYSNWAAPEWFAELNFPFPVNYINANVNWIVAGALEFVLGGAIILGVFTRHSAIMLLYIVIVAVYTVHFDLGWAGWNQIETDMGQGFKVPLMMGVMLFNLIVQGAGIFSWDAFWKSREIYKI